MSKKRPQETISYNMSRIKSKGTVLEEKLEAILKTIDYHYFRQPKLFGRPDFAYPQFKIAIFADSHFWHGYNWEKAQNEIQTNREFWLPKIERNIKRDKYVSQTLEKDGWTVLRFWQSQISNEPSQVKLTIQNMIQSSIKERS